MDDEIEAEYPILISQTLSNSLYQLQFPTSIQPSSRQLPIVSGRIKLNSSQVSLNLPLQSEYGNEYDITNIPYNSSLHSNTTSLFAGLIVDDQLHLTPISASLVFTQDLSHYDKLHEKKQPVQSSAVVEKTLHLSVKKQLDPNEQRELDIAAQRQAKLAEVWANLAVFHQSSIESQDLMHSLYCSDEQEVQCTSSPASYLDQIGPLTAQGGSSNVRILADILQMTLPHLVTNLMVNGIVFGPNAAQILPFSEIRSVIPAKHSSDEVVVALSECALLVDGCWIVKTNFLYPPSGRVHESRNYILSQFSIKAKPTRANLNAVCGLKHEMISQMLSEIAVCDTVSRCWKLKWDPDTEFCDMYPQVLEMQRDIILALEKKAIEFLTGKGAPAVATFKSKNVSSTKLEATLLFSDMTGTNAREQVIALIQDACNAHGVVGYDFIKNAIRVRKETKNSANLIQGNAVDDDFIKSCIKECCNNLLKDRYVLKVTGNTQIDEFRKYVVALFKDKDGHKKVDILAACEKGAGKECPNAVYLKIMKEIAYSKGPIWRLKESPD